jgi:glycosyltransferase involved in cell wall biosynthesis
LITCSNIPVFVEISQTAFTFFDPASAVSMTSALQATLKLDKSKYITEHKKDYADILSRFSWQNTAKLFLTGVHQSMPAGPKKRLAIFCPSPSSYSAVGKYAFEVHAELSRLFDIDYYAEEGLTAFEPTRPNILEYAANYYPAVTFSHDQADRYDYILYNLGNSEFHIDTILNALRLPANAIVHDTYLNGIFDWLERNGFMVSGRRRLEAILDKRFEVKDSSCLVSLVTNQHTIFCFSDFADKAIKQIVSGKKPEVVQILQPIGVPTLRRERFGKPTVSWAGIISEDKGIGMVAEIANNPNVQIKVFGFGVLGDSPLLQELGDNVSIMKDLTDKEFQDNLQQTEILVNYRPNYHGETSRSTLEAMRHGAVVIVKETGWYSELPDDVVVKVSAEHEIVAAINKLLADPKQIDKIAIKAQDYLREKYGYKQYAELMMKGLA